MSEPFTPKFDTQGLLTAVAVDAADNRVLMVAFMNAGGIRNGGLTYANQAGLYDDVQKYLEKAAE